MGESPTMSMQCLLTSSTHLMAHLRFLQLQHRSVHDSDNTPVAELTDADVTSWLTLDEVVEHELTFELSPFDLEAGGTVLPVLVEGGVEGVPLGKTRGARSAAVEAMRYSLIGTHVIIEALDAEFVSMLEPPAALAAPAAACMQHRCWPVLGGEPGDAGLLLGLPILLDDHPEIPADGAPIPGAPEQAWPVLPDIRDAAPPRPGSEDDFRDGIARPTR